MSDETITIPPLVPSEVEGDAPAAIPFPFDDRPHREAQVLAFTAFIVNGVEINLTMREGATADQAKKLLLELGQVTKWLKTELKATPCLSRNAQDGLAAERARNARITKQGPITSENGYDTEDDEEPQTEASPALPSRAAASRMPNPPQRPTNGATQTKAPAKPAAPAKQAEKSFPAERLYVDALKGGKAYWKLAGGKLTKYGVRVWPEVLATVDIDVDTLDVREEVDLSDWDMTAFYVENDEGKPDKVVRLVFNS